MIIFPQLKRYLTLGLVLCALSFSVQVSAQGKIEEGVKLSESCEDGSGYGTCKTECVEGTDVKVGVCKNGTSCCVTKVLGSCKVKDPTGKEELEGFCQKSCGKGYKSGGACTGGVCCVLDSTTQGSAGYFNTYGYVPPLGSATIPQIIARFISQVLPLIGALFFLMFLWGGFQWFTAGGDDTKVKGARATLVNAVIGISIVIFAYSIVSWLISVFAAGLKK